MDRPMTTRLRFTAVLLALFAAACQPQEAKAPPNLETFKSGEFAELDVSQDLAIPTSAFTDITGAQRSFADAEFKGKVVVFNVWAEWCAPCVAEMPSLAKLQANFDKNDVIVVPIAFGYEKDRESTKNRLAKLVGDQLPFYYDTEFNVNADAQTGAFPSTIIYGKDGKERARLMRDADWSTEEARKLVQAVVDGAA
jgi:thiol-disulfide isomerase/thioredoxin